MTFTTKLTIATASSIKLQTSSLAQLTQATNQLTRTALVKNHSIFNCTSHFQLIRALHRIDVINCR